MWLCSDCEEVSSNHRSTALDAGIDVVTQQVYVFLITAHVDTILFELRDFWPRPTSHLIKHICWDVHQFGMYDR